MFGKKRKIQSYANYYQKKAPLTRPRQQGRELKRSNPRTERTKKLLKLITIIAFVLTLIYGLFFSSYFDIKQISFGESEKNEITTAISKKLQSQINKSLIFLDTEELEVELISQFSELESLKIKKDYPNILVVELSKYPQIANIINQSDTLKKSFIINSIGYSVKENFENPQLPSIKITSDDPLNTKNPLIQKDKLDYILAAAKDFEDKFGMKVKEIDYRPIPREVRLLTEKGFYIWLDVQKSSEDQFKKLKKALAKLDIYHIELEYIDLRIAANNGDRIIYKPK